MVLDGLVGTSPDGFLGIYLVGLATPLTAACALPLYPSFISYLGSISGSGTSDGGRSVLLLGLLVVGGVLTFMGSVGYLFGFVLESSITVVVESVSPIAFVILAVVGAVLVVAPTAFARLPAVEPPQSEYPTASAFGYGFFFGAIVIPCNPGLIALFFTGTPVLFDTQLESFLGFLVFGLGIGTPLLVLALLSEPFSRTVTRTIARHSGPINRVVGLVLVAVSVYYLGWVFKIVPIPGV